MDSARNFVRLWLVLTAAVLVYAWVDLRLHPHLNYETQFTLEPDFGQIQDLFHWGGRLLNHGAVWLLVGNALVLAGLLALAARGVLSLVRRLQNPRVEQRISVVPGSVPTSVRPPRMQ